MKIRNLKLKIVKRGIPRAKSRGFTLIEMLLAVFVFMILFLIASSFVNLAAGSTKSNRTKILTNDMRNTMDTISQKMNNANGVATALNPQIYGFNVYTDVDSNHILGIVTDSPAKKCTFFGYDAVGKEIMMLDGACPTDWPTIGQLTQPLTSSKNILVTNFTLTKLNNRVINGIPASSVAFSLGIVISAEDADPKYQSDNKIDLKTLYTMDYQTIKRLQAQ